jgi:hypothetical protein
MTAGAHAATVPTSLDLRRRFKPLLHGARVAAKKFVPMLANVRLERYAEGRSAQVMHVGPFANEPETIAKLLTSS